MPERTGPVLPAEVRARRSSAPAPRVAVFAVLLGVLLAGLGGCSSSGADAVHEVDATSIGGQPGIGPKVATSGSASGTRTTALADRVLEVGTVTTTPAADAGLTRVVVAVALRNTTPGPVTRAPADFRLLVAGGDAFSPVEPAASDPSEPIEPGTTWRGSIAFGVPTALVARPQLLYRPAGASDTVLVPLDIASSDPTGVQP